MNVPHSGDFELNACLTFTFRFQDVLNNSDHQAVLQLTNLIAGRYFFTLEVEDEEGLKSSDTASVIVNPSR